MTKFEKPYSNVGVLYRHILFFTYLSYRLTEKIIEIKKTYQIVFEQKILKLLKSYPFF